MTVKKRKISRRKPEKPKNLSIKFRMNKDERNENKQKKNNKKEEEKKQQQQKNTRGKVTKKGAGQLAVHLSLSVVVFYGGG